MAVIVTTDSTCDLPKEELEKYHIHVVPLTVTLGERSGHDGIEITPEDIYEYVEKTGQLPKSSSVNVDEYRRLFKNVRNDGDEIVHISLSGKISGSWQNACTAAEETSGVYVVDSENLSNGQGLLVLRAAEMAQNGLEAAEIVERCRELTGHIEASFIINEIDYLYKGGRCSALSALSASVLHIKPCIEVHNGVMSPGRKYHGSINHAVKAYIEDRLKDRTDIDLSRIFVNHTQCDAQIVEEMKELVREYQPGVQEIIEAAAGSTITTHCGPNTFSVMFMTKSKE